MFMNMDLYTRHISPVLRKTGGDLHVFVLDADKAISRSYVYDRARECFWEHTFRWVTSGKTEIRTPGDPEVLWLVPPEEREYCTCLFVIGIRAPGYLRFGATGFSGGTFREISGYYEPLRFRNARGAYTPRARSGPRMIEGFLPVRSGPWKPKEDI